MTAPEDQNGLREALAYPQWREVVRLLEGCMHPLSGPAVRLFRDEGRLILEALNLVIAERDAARRERLPHMCRDDHAEIRHAVSDDDERCPVCRERDRALAAEAERSAGYLFHNPDTGTEWSESHPVESGEVDDATDIRLATAPVLKDEMIQAWEDADILRSERDRAFALNAAAEAEITRLKEGMEALRQVRGRIVSPLHGGISDTLWMTPTQTIVDFIDAALAAIPTKEITDV